MAWLNAFQLENPVVLGLVAGAYALGAIPFGLLLALFVGKTDVRELGSGNIGATNVARVVGKKLGILTLVLDALKGALPVVLARYALELGEPVQALAGLSAFLGHCYPVWLKFKGGKGVATGLGLMLGLLPAAAGVGLLAFGVVVAITKKVSAGSLAAAPVVVFAASQWLLTPGAKIALLVMLVVLTWRHRSNMARLWHKSELRV